MVYEKIPIVDTARRCGLVLDSRTLRRREVEASCPFCGDHGKGKYHLSLNTATDQFRCNLCGAHGNSVTLYAMLNGVSNKQAYQELSKGTNIYPIPKQPTPQKTEQERQLVVDSLKKAQFGDVLEKMPKGIDTYLTKEFEEDGFVCSGGQAQKVAIARVFAKNPDVVILDEPSSALDPIAEYNMYHNMMEASEGKTVFFISHRMSSARMADRVLFLEHGRIVEEGTHQELLGRNGRYAEMFRLQAQNYQNEMGGGLYAE